MYDGFLLPEQYLLFKSFKLKSDETNKLKHKTNKTSKLKQKTNKTSKLKEKTVVKTEVTKGPIKRVGSTRLHADRPTI